MHTLEPASFSTTSQDNSPNTPGQEPLPMNQMPTFNTPSTPTKQAWYTNPAALVGVTIMATLLIVGTGVFAYTRMSGSTGSTAQEATPTPKPKKKVVTIPVNTIDVSQRPYITIEPTPSGRDVQITLHTLKKTAPEASYTLEYQTGSLLQGVQGELKTDSLPSQTTQLLGSCSAGGACTIHKDVRGGTIQVQFTGGAEEYAIKEEFSYTENVGTAIDVTSLDKEFTLKGTSSTRVGVVVVLNSSGYPDELPGTLASNIYNVTTAQGIGIKGKATVSIKTKATGSAKIAVYDGTSWKTVDADISGDIASASVDGGQLFAVVE